MITIKRKKKFTYKKQICINNFIRATEVRAIMPDGTKAIMKTRDAIEKAKEYGLDLVEVSPKAKPPVCKIVDLGKYKYELEKKTKESKKHQTNVTLKEMRMSPKIQEHDYQTKMTHIKKFLEQRHKVRINILFKGREITHKELGMAIAEKVEEDLKDLAQIEFGPKFFGRTITLIFNPLTSSKKVNKKPEKKPEEKQEEKPEKKTEKKKEE